MAKGSIEKVGSGFRAKVYAGLDPITKQQIYLNGPVRQTETDAAKDVTGLLRRAESGNHPDRSATVSHLFERWLAVADLEVSTRETNEGYIRRIYAPTIGDMPIRKLQDRVDILDRLYGHLRDCSQLCGGKPGLLDHRTTKPHDCAPKNKDGTPKAAPRECQPHVCKSMPPATVWRINAILSAACNYAMSWGWIDRNPAALAHKPKLRKKRARPQTAEQVATLINLAFETDFEFGIFLWLAATTGARRGELCALLWKHIDLAHGLILLEDNFIVRNGQRIRKPPKTDEVRPLSLDDFGCVLLSDLKASKQAALARVSAQLRPDACVFSPEIDGSIEWNPDTFTHKYERLAKRLGIEAPLKNLRHFNATQLMSGGIDLSTVAGRLGHADGGVTTLRFYADWIRPADKRAAELVSQGLTELREKLLVAQPEEDDTSTPGQVSKVRPVVAALTAAIESGELAPGDKLPTLKALSETHGVSYGTAQLAVAQLREAGLVAVERGRSAVVLSPE